MFEASAEDRLTLIGDMVAALNSIMADYGNDDFKALMDGAGNWTIIYSMKDNETRVLMLQR